MRPLCRWSPGFLGPQGAHHRRVFGAKTFSLENTLQKGKLSNSRPCAPAMSCQDIFLKLPDGSWTCLLCDRGATDEHVGSKKHEQLASTIYVQRKPSAQVISAGDAGQASCMSHVS